VGRQRLPLGVEQEALTGECRGKWRGFAREELRDGGEYRGRVFGEAGVDGTTGAINECLLASEGDSCPFPKRDLCVSMVQRTVASRLVRFLLVTLMIVKEASDLSFKRGCLLRIPDSKLESRGPLIR
jgi:hypothetical protein